MSARKEPKLGDLAKDSVTGFKGVVVACCEWLHGCARLTLQPQELDKDGKPRETQTFDSLQLVVVKEKAVAAQQIRTGAAAATGGPNDDRAALRRR